MVLPIINCEGTIWLSIKFQLLIIHIKYYPKPKCLFIIRFIFIVELGIVLIILIDYLYYRYRHGFSYIYELDKGE